MRVAKPAYSAGDGLQHINPERALRAVDHTKRSACATAASRPEALYGLTRSSSFRDWKAVSRRLPSEVPSTMLGACVWRRARLCQSRLPHFTFASFALEGGNCHEPIPLFDYQVAAVLTFKGEVDVRSRVESDIALLPRRAGAQVCLSAIGAGDRHSDDAYHPTPKCGIARWSPGGTHAWPPEAGIKTSPLLRSFVGRRLAASQRQGGAIALGLRGTVACSDPQRRNSFDHFRD